MTRGVIFDLDGVLVDTSPIWHAVMNDAARELGYPLVSAAQFKATFGQGTASDVDSFFPGAEPDDLDAVYERRFIARMSSVERITGAHRLLDELGSRGILRAVATNTVRPLAELLLERTGIGERVDAVVTASDVPRPKPAPDMLLRALQKLRLERSQVWFVGDSAYDADAARQAQIRFVGFRRDGDRRIDILPRMLDVVGNTTLRRTGSTRPSDALQRR